MIENERIKLLNNKNIIKNGKRVIYWMQADQREEYNHALEFSIAKANELKKPVSVFFGVYDKYPGANLRHYHFMLYGLYETAVALKQRGISFDIKICRPDEGVIEVAKDACLVVVDRGYTRHQKEWRENVAKKLKCAFYQVESSCIVPVEVASNKEEYSAATIRKKILSKIDFFLKEVKKQKPLYRSKYSENKIFNVEELLSKLNIDRSVLPITEIKPGTNEAKRKLKIFIDKKLKRYAECRNDPSLSYESGLSPYLHFGQISSLYVALEVLKAGEKINGTFIDQLVIRRELAINFVNFNINYDNIKCLPKWALKTLFDHENDRRPYIYSLNELEYAKTHDPYWNAAQLQMIKSGKMHNYMRMYWGKKVIEWTPSIEEAYKRLVYLNDKYELDGRDPNGYAGIAWCFGKHDRAWTERQIFGKVRYMNSAGLKRKFNMNEYILKWLNVKEEKGWEKK